MFLSQTFDNFLIISKLLLYLINGVGLELALWIYVTDRKKKINQLFSLFTVCLLLWLDFDFAAAMAPFLFSGGDTLWITLFSTRVMFALLCAFFASFYLLPAYYLSGGKPNKTLDGIHMAVWILLFIISFTSLVVNDVLIDPQDPIAYQILPGGIYLVYVAAAVLSFCVTFFNLWKKFRQISGDDKKKNVLLLSGLTIFGMFNIAFNIILPVVANDRLKDITLLGDFVVMVVLGFGAYTILKERMLGIKVILIEVFVGLMGASLAVIPFFVDIAWLQVLLFSLFFLFCVFGYLLIKGVVDEYREKVKLEESVRLRTKELEEAKKNLEEMNSILEVRVRARTEELQKLNSTLEQKVEERTNDLQEKIEDLEKFRSITVGRELRMIELKKEIGLLQERIAALDAKNAVVESKDIEKFESDKPLLKAV
jgi:hypothetical protein